MSSPAEPDTTTPLHDGTEHALIGRERELRALLACVAERRCALVTGAPGVGKTALVDAALDAAGAASAAGTCVEVLGHRRHLPLIQVLGRPPRSDDPTAVADDVRGAVGGAVVVVDDLQWADPDTLLALPHIAQTGPLIAICRSGTEAEALAASLGDGAPRGPERIELAPLSPADARALARRHLGPEHALAEEHIAVASAGHPLTIEVLCETGGDLRRSSVPSLQATIDALAEPTRVTLARAHLRDPGLVADDPEVASLVGRGLAVIAADGSIAPRGDLIGELALDSLGAEERRALHRGCAERAHEPADAARHHLEAGDVDAAHAAALEALRGDCSLAERSSLLTLAASTTTGERRIELAREAGEMLLRRGQPTAAWEIATEHFGPLDELPLHHRLAYRALEVRLLIDAARYAEARELADHQLALCDRTTTIEQYYLLTLRAGARAGTFDVPGAITDLDHAIDLAAEHGIDDTRARATRAMISGMLGDRQAMEDTERLLEGVADAPEPQIAFETAIHVAHFGLLQPASSRTARLLEKLGEAAQTCDCPGWSAEVTVLGLQARAGNLEGGDPRPALDRLLRSPSAPSVHVRAAALAAVANADRGDLPAARRGLELLPPCGAASGAASVVEWARAEVAWHTGTAVTLDTPEISASALGDPTWHELLVLRRWLALAAGEDVDALPQPLPVTSPVAGLVAEAEAISSLAGGRFEDAASRFEDAAEALEDGFARASLRCRWAAADAHRQAGDRSRAAGDLAVLAGTCDRLGLVALGWRVEASLRAVGVTRRPDAPTDERPGGVTPRQREILELVGQGLSTPDIAAVLRLSPGTVDTHVKLAMQAIGARTRWEAAAHVQSTSTADT